MNVWLNIKVANSVNHKAISKMRSLLKEKRNTNNKGLPQRQFYFSLSQKDDWHISRDIDKISN